MPKNSPTPTLPQNEREPSFLSPAEEGLDATAWADQLKDRDKSGSYRLGCSLAQLQASVRDAGLALFEADLQGVKGKQNFLAALAAAAHVPAGFGANWDALADALCDLSWVESGGYVLLLHNAGDSLGLSANDREIARDIFADAVSYWRQRNKPCWIFYA